MLEYTITAHHTASSTATASCARAPAATLALDTSPDGRPDAFNPAELLLTAVAACMVKGLERATPLLKFSLRDATVRVHGVREDVPPRLATLDYEIVVDTDESDDRLALLHRNIQKFGTVYNTIASAVTMNGTIRRKESRAHVGESPLANAAVASASASPVDEIC